MSTHRQRSTPRTSASRPRSSLDGSDAMNPDPDYSAAYVVIRTDAADGLEGHAFVFTIGRGNDVQVAALDALARPPPRPGRRGAPRRHGRRVATARRTTRSCAGSARRRASCTWRSARSSTRCGTSAPSAPALPLWQHLAGLSPEELVVARRLPLPHRRAHPRRGARDPPRRRARPRRARSRGCSRTATPPTRRRPAGSATPTRSSRGSAARPSPTASRRSSSRSAPTSTTTVRRLAHRAPSGRARTSRSRSTRTSAGMSRTPSRG